MATYFLCFFLCFFFYSFASSLTEEKVNNYKEMFQMFDKVYMQLVCFYIQRFIHCRMEMGQFLQKSLELFWGP